MAEQPDFRLKDKFRGRRGKTKLPPRTFVEKSRFAIDTQGEKLGIPFSPIRQIRLREAVARKKAGRIISATRMLERKQLKKIKKVKPSPIQLGRMRFANVLAERARGKVNLVNRQRGKILFVAGRNNAPFKLPSVLRIRQQSKQGRVMRLL